MTALHYAFEPFSTLKDVLNGQPIKIMPLGKFFRDDRELNITPDVLQEMAAHFQDGLPRFTLAVLLALGVLLDDLFSYPRIQAHLPPEIL